jgi:microcystin-dependent protein
MTVQAMAIPQTFSFSTGTILWMASATTPSGMLPCDGAAVSRTTYANLFAIIGTKFGVGNGSTTFNVPDLGGNVLIGYKAADSDYNDMGKKGGEKTHVLTEAELAAHSHDIYLYSTGSGGANRGTVPDRTSGNAGITSDIRGSNTAHENRPPFVTSYAYIKT